MNQHEALVFLVSLAALLGTARVLGEVARAIRLPLVVGEIVAGIVLGKTGIGRLVPQVYEWLFANTAARTMLGAYTTLAVVLLLVVAGLEVDLSVVRRRGRSALGASILGILFPLVLGVGLGFILPASDLVSPGQRTLFAFFLGVALSISALPVIAKTLLDLGLFKTDVGLLVMAAAMVGDLVGWLAFSILLGPLQGGSVDVTRIATTMGLTLALVLGSLFIGRRAVDRLLVRLESEQESAPGRILSLVIVLALCGASVTHAIGIHAVFGGFVVGVMIGDSPNLRERTRAVISEFVTNIFAPVFFASLGLTVDFVSAFDLRLCLLVFFVATIAKVGGATLGAHLGGLRWRESGAVGFGLNARGAMEIILALLALEGGLIREQVFVALVFMAVMTSLVSGPVMKILLYRPKDEEGVVGLFNRGAFVPSLQATLPMSAIDELLGALKEPLGDLATRARTNVIERELTASTGLGDEIAIPHAGVPGLKQSLLALGRAPHGIDFDSPDGKAATIIFLLLVPAKAYEEEVQILASIARSVFDRKARAELLAAKGKDEVAEVLGASAARIAAELKKRKSAPSFVGA